MNTHFLSVAKQIRHIVRELRLRFKLWKKPKADCCYCCLWCKWFSVCRWEVEEDTDKWIQ